MRTLRLAIKIILVFVVIVSAPVIALSNLVIMEETNRAKDRYRETVDYFRDSQDGLREVEDKLRRLTSSVEAVEVEARQQLRLVRPGESLILIQQENPANPKAIQASAPVVVH